MFIASTSNRHNSQIFATMQHMCVLTRIGTQILILHYHNTSYTSTFFGGRTQKQLKSQIHPNFFLKGKIKFHRNFVRFLFLVQNNLYFFWFLKLSLFSNFWCIKLNPWEKKPLYFCTLTLPESRFFVWLLMFPAFLH